MRDYIVLTINEIRHEIRGQDIFMMLADFLRRRLFLCGTKIVCAEGDCGACTVLCLKPKSKKKHFDAINACIALVANFDGAHIYTVEALKKNGQLSLIQKSLVKHHASQCGYCTPGFVMALTALYERKSGQALLHQQIKNALTGNLCRCTGYLSIIEGAKNAELKNYKPLFSTEIKHDKTLDENIEINDQGKKFYAPTTIKDALIIKKNHPNIIIAASTTDLGVSHNKQKIELSSILSLHLIDELYEIKNQERHFKVGALATLSDVRKACRHLLPEFARFLNIFASPQIKNSATLIGNVANASPIADTVPVLMVLDARALVMNTLNKREIACQDLYTGYKTLAINSDELITHISFTAPSKSQFLRLYKSSQRKDLDISAVNAAFFFDYDAQAKIKEARIAVGGVAQKVIRLYELEEFLKDKTPNDDVIKKASSILVSLINPIDDLRASSSYRIAVMKNILNKIMIELRNVHAAS